MKKLYITKVALGALLTVLAGNANAYLIEGNIQVGSQDELISAATVASAFAEEKAWVESLLSGYTFYENDKIDDLEQADWEEVTGDGDLGLAALDLGSDWAYFFIKTGNVGTGYDHFMFKNNDSFQYAVISKELIIDGVNYGTLKDFGMVSHIGPVGDPGNEVPEPTTMLLFGTGLIGLAGLARRKSN